MLPIYVFISSLENFHLSQSAEVVRVLIQQMEPDLMDVGSNLGETIRYQTVHEELINKLKVNSVIMIVFI